MTKVTVSPFAIGLLFVAVAASAAQLPQTHDYQKQLRNYMATLKEADFEVMLEPVKYVEAHFSDPDTLARYWMLFLTPSADIPSSEGIRVAPEHFTLAAVEAAGVVSMKVGRRAFMDPKDTAWWSQWDYPGNPYYNSKPIKLRAFVASAVDLMMQDQEHDAGKNKRSDYLGGSMIRFGYTYHVVKDAVPEPARKAYETGLMRMFAKLEKMTPSGSGGSDMEFFQLVGMWYAADALGKPYKARALKRAGVVIDRITTKTGYEKHGGAFDVSYQGIALRFLTWAAVLYEDPKISEALHKMLVLKSHLSLPEPDGALFGPTHFNTATAEDAPHDQWAWVSRDAAMSMIDDDALYSFFARSSIPDEAKMMAQVKKGIERLKTDQPSKKSPTLWAENHWNNTLNYAFDHYRTGFYKRLVQLKTQQSMLTKPPFARNERFIRDLNDGGEFLAARFPDYGAIIHTGAIAGTWAGGVSGKSGGSLSAFWTPERGTAILGRGRATQGKEYDEWTDAHNRGPYTWGVHAITGMGAGGKYFSTSRIRKIESKYDTRGTESAVVTVTGDLAGSKWADPGDELKGDVTYLREFRLDETGVEISSALTSDRRDEVRELWEMIPVYFGDKYHHRIAPMAEVGFRVSGTWQPASETVVETSQVRLSRYGKHATITFDKPRRMKLSPELGDRTHGNATVRNIMIDLRIEGGQPSVRYKITPKP